MAHVLLGWELGANRGHAVRIAHLARRLREAGHRVSVAVQRLDTLDPDAVGPDAVWQAPVTPRFLISAAQPIAGPPAGMADVLARVGIDDPALVAAMVRAWERLFEAIRPDVLIADFAPFLHLAARDRLPLIATGTGYSLPPTHLATLPALIEGIEGVDQGALLQGVNDGLRRAGRAAIDRVPAIWAADRVVLATLPELDPYAANRADSCASPLDREFDARAGDGDEVFVYAPERLTARSPIWRGLASSGLRVRVHVARIGADLRAGLRSFGFAVEPDPVPFARIAERSRLLVSHGGHGFVCAGLVAGLPQVVFHFDLEKLLHGVAVARIGVGGHVALGALKPDQFGADLARLHADDALAARARTMARSLQARAAPPAGDAIVDAVAALA
jgi:hypothetical protein